MRHKPQTSFPDNNMDNSSKTSKSIENEISSTESSSVSSSLLMAMLVGSIPSFQMGFAIGVLNPLTTVASTALNCSSTDLMGWPLIVSCFCPAGFIGTSLAAPTMKKGLVSSLNFSCIVCIISNILCGAAAFVPSNGFGLLLLGRIGLGVASGVGTVVSPVYFGDISPPHLKGIVGAAYQLASVLGILISQIMAVNMATPELYGYLLLSPTIISVVQLMVSPLMLIESPVWLRAHGMPVEASKASKRLGGGGGGGGGGEEGSHEVPEKIGQGNIEAQIDSIEGSIGQVKQTSLSLVQIISDPKLGPALFLLLALQIGQQLSGINALFFYSTDFFKLAGLDNPTVGTLLASGINVVAVMFVLPLLVKTPRRKLLLIGLTGMLVSAVILTSALLALDDKDGAAAAAGDASPSLSAHGSSSLENVNQPISISPLQPQQEDISVQVLVVDDVVSSFVASYIPYVALMVVLTFIIFYELSIGLVPWIVAAETFPVHSKDAAFSLASATNWFASFVIGIAFPAVQSSLGSLCFLPFIGSILLSILTVYFLLPETYGFTIQENLDHVRAKWVSMSACFCKTPL